VWFKPKFCNPAQTALSATGRFFAEGRSILPQWGGDVVTTITKRRFLWEKTRFFSYFCNLFTPPSAILRILERIGAAGSGGLK